MSTFLRRKLSQIDSDIEGVESSLCLSLTCFSIDDVVDSDLDLSEDQNKPDVAPLLRLRSVWPTNYRLRATMGERNICLAPPLTV